MVTSFRCCAGAPARSLPRSGHRRRGAEGDRLDATPLFLDLARRDAKARGVDVHYLQGDMRRLPWTARFDGAINWFTAFGYFDDNELRQVLAEVARALKPGDGSPWSASTAAGSSASCSRPWSWCATATC